jgi:hypothetical protein
MFNDQKIAPWFHQTTPFGRDSAIRMIVKPEIQTNIRRNSPDAEPENRCRLVGKRKEINSGRQKALTEMRNACINRNCLCM